MREEDVRWRSGQSSCVVKSMGCKFRFHSCIDNTGIGEINVEVLLKPPIITPT
jgi:hypothetical protein